MARAGAATLSTHIFVRLLDEAVDVWRPVYAQRLDDGRYKIIEQEYDRNIEKWEFEPGDCVVCEMVDSSEGRFLGAVRQDTG